NRRLLATAAAFAALLVAGVVVSAWLAVRATHAETVAKEDRDKAVAAEAQANAESDKAKRSEAEARAVLNFFAAQGRAAARPKAFYGGLGKDATIRNALDAAEPKIAEAFREQPLVEASVRFELGNSYRLLGTMKPALSQFRCALEIRQAHL